MLAAIALTLSTVILFKMKRQRFAFVTILPTAWLLLCTLTAGLQKIFHPDAKIGFLAHAARFRDALAEGQMLAPAKTTLQMRQIIFNDYVNATLCAFFIVLVLSIIAYGVVTIRKALANERPTAQEVGDAVPV